MNTLASACARDIQTDELMREGVFAILGGDHVVMFKDGSMLLKASIDETTVYDVMQRHNYEPYTFPTVGAVSPVWFVHRREGQELSYPDVYRMGEQERRRDGRARTETRW